MQKSVRQGHEMTGIIVNTNTAIFPTQKRPLPEVPVLPDDTYAPLLEVKDMSFKETMRRDNKTFLSTLKEEQVSCYEFTHAHVSIYCACM